ncbi:MAG: MmgE/PrpD family protein [Acidilobaceae archaeon]|nr:MmgE/PrpD family protein [Acidilobaceae archaeon]
MRLSKKIAEWASSFSYKEISTEEAEELKKRVVDSFAVALAAFHEGPVRVARQLAELTASQQLSATIWGTGRRGFLEQAAFANACAVRYLDFNDTYLSKEALHPSDMIPALLAAAEAADADGKRLLEGMAVAYEIASRLADAFSVRGKGFDHVTYIAIGAAAGVAKVLGLGEEATEHAINIATTIAPALRQTRAGEISMWKACAAANAAKEGLLAALLASLGMTGPSPVFEGKFGFFNVISKEPFDIQFGKPLKVMENSIKNWPVEYHSMSAVEAAIRVRERLGPIRAEEVESVEIKTFTVSYKIIAEDPEKWDPKTRETADHSLPYIVAAALLDGDVWVESFSPQRFLAKDVREVMRRTRVEVDPKYDEVYPKGIPNRVEVKLKDGRSAAEESVYPPGHFMNPLSKEGVERKFWRLLKERVAGGEEFLSLAWSLERLDSVGSLARRLRIF